MIGTTKYPDLLITTLDTIRIIITDYNIRITSTREKLIIHRDNGILKILRIIK